MTAPTVMTGRELAGSLRHAATLCVRQAERWRDDGERAEEWRRLCDYVLGLVVDAWRERDGWRMAARVRGAAVWAWDVDGWDGIDPFMSTATEVLWELAETLADDRGGAVAR